MYSFRAVFVALIIKHLFPYQLEQFNYVGIVLDRRVLWVRLESLAHSFSTLPEGDIKYLLEIASVDFLSLPHLIALLLTLVF